MGKTTGFMEIERKEAPQRPLRQRIKDFDPLLMPEDPEELQLQAARCMDCGVSFCQASELVSGTSIGCPLGNPIPETNDLIYQGCWDEAYHHLIRTHPFPEITGRVCPALCEGSCVEGSFDYPVAIKDLERSLADYGLSLGITNKTALPQSGKHVAVVGSGPSGLACASALVEQGHKVTIFEKQDRLGGFLMYGIPNMKLEKSLLEKRKQLLEQQGVNFVFNCEVGTDMSAAKLQQDFDAVVLCIGARMARKLTVPGCNTRGVYSAVDYLCEATKAVLEKRSVDAALSAQDKAVIVVGGGDTGTDCIATAIRQGALSVAALEIMPMLPEHRAADNPWPLWPRLYKTDYGHKEAQEVFGKEVREYQTTLRHITNDGTKLTGVTTVQVEWVPNEKGQLYPKEIPGTEQTRKADLVLVAMGFSGVEPGLPTHMDLELTQRNCIATMARGSFNEESFATNKAGLFVAGDARRGPSLVVWALREGLKAAQCCNEYLAKQSDFYMTQNTVGH